MLSGVQTGRLFAHQLRVHRFGKCEDASESMNPGRNMPCPCGSGKKYKQCCLEAQLQSSQSSAHIVWRRVRRAINGLSQTILRHTVERLGNDAIEAAWEEFVLGSDAEGTPFDPETPHIQIFLPWFLHCWRAPGASARSPETTPTAYYLRARGSRLEPMARSYFEACLVGPFGFHEIVRCEPGIGFQTREIITGEERQVHEQSASASMCAGDILYGQLVDVEGITMLEACGACAIPPVRKIELVDLRKSLKRHIKLEGPALLRAVEDELRSLYLLMTEAVLNPPLPRLHNTDGDPLELQRLVYEVDSAQQAFDALAPLAYETTPEELQAGADRDAAGVLRSVEFSWAKAGNRKHASWTNTILGNIRIEGTRLSVEVNSAKRGKEFQRIVKKALGSKARFVATEIQSAEKMLTDVRKGGAGKSPRTSDTERELLENPEVQEHLQAMMRDHFENWVDMPLPALGNRTPMQAVRTRDGKEKVAALVLEAERGARNMNPPVPVAVLARLRQRLGLNPA